VGRLQRRLQMMAVGIVALVIYYGFLFDFALAAKESMVGVLQDKGVLSITVPMKVYNASSGEWVERSVSLDLIGLADMIMTLVLVLGPVVILLRTGIFP